MSCLKDSFSLWVSLIQMKIKKPAIINPSIFCNYVLLKLELNYWK